MNHFFCSLEIFMDCFRPEETEGVSESTDYTVASTTLCRGCDIRQALTRLWYWVALPGFCLPAWKKGVSLCMYGNKLRTFRGSPMPEARGGPSRAHSG